MRRASFWDGRARGMVRNYNEGAKRSPAPFPSHYDQTLGEADNDAVKWDFSKWKPELVVICLGTNDYSTTPHPDDSMYVGDYHKFIARVLGNYPGAAIVCVSTGDATFEKNAKRVVTEETTTFNHPKVYYAAYPDDLGLTGCDWHPSIDDNKKVARVLIDTIMKKLDWDTTAPVVAAMPLAAKKSGASCLLSSSINGDLLRLIAAESIEPGTIISLMNLRGELLDKRATGLDRGCMFEISRRSPGIYCAGNSRLGWVRVAVKR
ncbi:MAG: hypothetical protein JW913_05735 [Chitinispirillaceae bacterium]|nr:hypothetical protein [Chitinispirillaceae bacterium]